MVLQRDAKVKIWGHSAASEKIYLEFLGQDYSTRSDNNGNWHIILEDLKAGGPYAMKIKGKDSTIVLNDILIGDVWLCSGQSNMEIPISRVEWVYRDELSQINNDQIRQFYIPREYSFATTKEDVSSGAWVPASQENLGDFSAAAFFFAQEMYHTNQVPVGIINCALGGSPIEAWMSESALSAYPEQLKEAEKYKDSTIIQETVKTNREQPQAWYEKVWSDNYNAYGNDVESLSNFSDWKTIELPGMWNGSEMENINGMVWFKKKIQVPAEFELKDAMIVLGRIVDADSVFINGTFVGRTTYQYPPRRYHVPDGILHPGVNSITVQVISNTGTGGFVPDKLYAITTNSDTLSLVGKWHYLIGAKSGPTPPTTFIRWKPTGLYKGMLYPLHNFSVKGVLWYQGESNTSRPEEYADLLPKMIKDWRSLWDYDLPFIVAQLPNFMEPRELPQESSWAMLRESQAKVLSTENTALSVNIDLGEWNDIHPLNKKDVGKRMAMAARSLVDDPGFKGLSPMYKSILPSGDTVIVEFKNVYEGLEAHGSGNLQQFAICSEDKVFKKANAKIVDSKVYVWSNEVSNPVAVRYAWSDNPVGANLYNSAGLPASPFRTDEW